MHSKSCGVALRYFEGLKINIFTKIGNFYEIWDHIFNCDRSHKRILKFVKMLVFNPSKQLKTTPQHLECIFKSPNLLQSIQRPKLDLQLSWFVKIRRSSGAFFHQS